MPSNPANPILFKNYLQDLIDYLKEYTGLFVADEVILHRLWADDLFLVSTNESNSQIQLDGLSKFCTPNQMIVNNIKTKFMVFGKPTVINLNLNNEPLEEVSSYKCLGTVINKITTLRGDMFKNHPEYVNNQSRKAVFGINRKIRLICNIPPKCKFHLYQSMIQPILTYGSEMWGHNSKSCESLDKQFRWYVRNVLNVKTSTSTIIIIGESGLMPPSVFCHISTILYAIRLNSMSHDSTLWKTFTETKRIHEMGFVNWYSKVDKLAEKYNINLESMKIYDSCKLEIKRRIKSKFIDEWEKSVSNLIKFPVLRTYSLFKQQFGTPAYLIHVKDKKYRNALIKFRCSSHTLNIEKGRHTRPKTPIENRICCTCHTLEDGVHFIIYCTSYITDRKSLFDKLISVYPNFNLLTNNQKIIFLLKSEGPKVLTHF